MKTESYTCDECGLPIDGTSGPPSIVAGAGTLATLFWNGSMGDNRFLDPRHYHRYPCFDAVLRRILAKS